MARSSQVSFLEKKQDEKAYRGMLNEILEWALEGLTGLAGPKHEYERPRNPLRHYNVVRSKVWELYRKTGDTLLVDAYEKISESMRWNLPVPLNRAGCEPPGKKRRRDANEKLLLAYCVALQIEPRRPYQLIQAHLNSRGFSRSVNAIPMRVSAFRRQLGETKRVEWVIHDELQSYRNQRFQKKYPHRLVEVRETTLAGGPFTSLTVREELFVRELVASCCQRFERVRSSSRDH